MLHLASDLRATKKGLVTPSSACSSSENRSPQLSHGELRQRRDNPTLLPKDQKMTRERGTAESSVQFSLARRTAAEEAKQHPGSAARPSSARHSTSEGGQGVPHLCKHGSITEWQHCHAGDTWSREALPHCQLSTKTALPDSNTTHTARTVLENTPTSAVRQETQPTAFAFTAVCFSGNLTSKIEHCRCFDSFGPYI